MSSEKNNLNDEYVEAINIVEYLLSKTRNPRQEIEYIIKSNDLTPFMGAVLKTIKLRGWEL